MKTLDYCPSCAKNVIATKRFHWPFFLLTWFFYLAYYLLKPRNTCPICGGKTVRTQGAEDKVAATPIVGKANRPAMSTKEGECSLCGKRLNFLNRPMLKMGVLTDGGELCISCRGKVIFALHVKSIKQLSSEEVRQGVDPSKSIREVTSRRMKDDMAPMKEKWDRGMQEVTAKFKDRRSQAPAIQSGQNFKTGVVALLVLSLIFFVIIKSCGSSDVGDATYANGVVNSSYTMKVGDWLADITEQITKNIYNLARKYPDARRIEIELKMNAEGGEDTYGNKQTGVYAFDKVIVDNLAEVRRYASYEKYYNQTYYWLPYQIKYKVGHLLKGTEMFNLK